MILTFQTDGLGQSVQTNGLLCSSVFSFWKQYLMNGALVQTSKLSDFFLTLTISIDLILSKVVNIVVMTPILEHMDLTIEKYLQAMQTVWQTVHTLL